MVEINLYFDSAAFLLDLIRVLVVLVVKRLFLLVVLLFINYIIGIKDLLELIVQLASIILLFV